METHRNAECLPVPGSDAKSNVDPGTVESIRQFMGESYIFKTINPFIEITGNINVTEFYTLT